ncbi:MAG TPA: hypothetical protein VME23_21980 [Terracidiphilus sp.]|nr:hypothetical protein [Terracidiphilus sp.]
MSETIDCRWVEQQVARTSAAWRACAGLPLPPATRYTPRDQHRREAEYDRAMHAVERESEAVRHSRAGRLAAQERILKVFSEFATVALSLPADAVDLITGIFLPAGAEFTRRSRRFDPGLTMASIIQACRNAWTVCGLQPLLGEPARITPSITGYSLLYPYTDNFLDAEGESPAAKREFCLRFRQRLRGVSLAAANPHEASVWTLVEMVESQYPRALYPQVFDSMLAIHQAQEESIAQLTANRSNPRLPRFLRTGFFRPRLHGAPSADRILAISCAKGGTSVLADACLVRGCVSAQESRLAFDWGALLQLGDDLQDVREDLRRGAATLFTVAAANGVPLDALVCQLLNYAERIGTEMDQFAHGSYALKNLLRTSWRSLIVAAIANAREFFTPAFVRQIETTAQFRFGFLAKRHQRVSRCNGLYANVFDILSESKEEELVEREELCAEVTG